MAAIPLPPLNLSSNAASSAKGDATFGGNGAMNINFGQQGMPAWVPFVALGLAALWLYKRKG